MALMLASESMQFFRSVGLTEVIGPFVVLAVIIFFAILWYVREGRNGALEHILAQSEFGSPGAFRGTLAIAEHQPGIYLRLSKSSGATSHLQFYYRWVAGKGRQAVFDEVTFDGFRRLVDLKR